MRDHVVINFFLSYYLQFLVLFLFLCIVTRKTTYKEIPFEQQNEKLKGKTEVINKCYKIKQMIGFTYSCQEIQGVYIRETSLAQEADNLGFDCGLSQEELAKDHLNSRFILSVSKTKELFK